MKRKYIFCYFMFFMFHTWCQSQTTNLNFIILVDDVIVNGALISNERLVVNGNDGIQDSIKFKYEIGEMLIGQEDWQKIVGINVSDIQIKFDFYRECPKKEIQSYSYSCGLNWINSRYAILRIFDFSNPKNKKCFRDKEGFGAQMEIPGFSTILLRKKKCNRKFMKENCIEME